jgi:SAM-dependent methyltransferase
MMYGTRERFDYLECQWCGSLFLKDMPRDMGRFYPRGYYSFAPKRHDAIMARLVAQALLLMRRFPLLRMPAALVVDLNAFAWIEHMLDLPRSSRVLDVGCGRGMNLLLLAGLGFSELTGIDPYLPDHGRPGGGVVLMKTDLQGLEGSFDVVMFHHSFEHLPDPGAVFPDLARVLAPGGRVLVRMPVAQSFAWRTYGVDWVQLDAPRHLCVCSEKGFREMAARNGFSVEEVLYDSGAFQFWGSEQYRRDIPLNDGRSYRVNKGRSPFGRRDMARFRERAGELNALGDGDQACFVLVKKT